MDILNILSNSRVFPEKPEKVEVIQTHISMVFLTGNFVYKFKKSVNFGFLDFSTLEKRKYYCKEELRLNKRLSPEIYLELVELNYDKQNNSYNINGIGEIIDYGIKMKEFQQDKILKQLVKKNKLSKEHISQIVDILVKFYETAATSEEINKYGTVKSFKINTDENFDQTKNVIGTTITKKQFDLIKNNTNKFYKNNEQLFNKRIEDNKIRECHGDLHTGNMFLNDKNQVRIFDCIEFNERFKNSDVATDIAFLAMDLDFNNETKLSEQLILEYVGKSGDWNLLKLLNFYKCYRAYVRGKVIGFLLSDSNFPNNKKNFMKSEAKKYFDLATNYAKNMDESFTKFTKPTLLVMVALSGSGKTIISKMIRNLLNIEYLSSDDIRKEMFLIEKTKKTHLEYNQGIYSPENREKIYDIMFEKSEEYLSQGKNVLLDSAGFIKKIKRDKALEIAKKLGVEIRFVHLEVPDNIVKKWIVQKMNNKEDSSDFHLNIYEDQKKSKEQFTKEEQKYLINYYYDDYVYMKDVYENIIKKIK